MFKTLPLAIIAILAAILKSLGLNVGEENLQAIYEAGLNLFQVLMPTLIIVRNQWSKRNDK